VHDYTPGQRWISNTELQMGLGTVLTVEHRTVTVLFLATGETRTYAKQSAPLTRVNFVCGDKVSSCDGWSLRIESIDEQDGLLTYYGTKDNGEKAELPEGQLDNLIQLNRPTDRLFSGQIDKDKWFELRYQTRLKVNALAHSDLRGLTGVRTSLIPHQLYIAHEVANRYAPRVLLADEVGLGKTIEAGLILHHQLLTERAHRVLIIVPETLVHQWLVEMLRRFNLHFSIFDEERCQAIEESTDQENPFYTEQLVLCNLEFLSKQPERFKQAYTGNWDLLVVDEAHHLEWAPAQASLEYELIDLLAAETKGVLLLTATPEQLGQASHFARLRLLDPDRFPDLDTFVKEEASYEPIAQAMEELLGDQPLSKKAYATLLSTIEEGDNQRLLETLSRPKPKPGSDKDQNVEADKKEIAAAKNDLIEHLLDRHGTGRVLFRNTRAAVKGFPDRKMTSYALPLPADYIDPTDVTDTQLLLCPELLHQSTEQSAKQAQHTQKIQQEYWTQIDPRVDWLSDQLKQLRPNKVLVITADAGTVLDLADALRSRTGTHAAVFHEGMSIVERDRAAAYFADHEDGSQMLICSEIGSEGRNFQFAHHLILFDLPLNPDLLEQRIGRLDRIGQTETVKIHVPYLENSAQAVMLHWYHDGLNAFEHTCPAGHNVFVEVKQRLIDALHDVGTLNNTKTCTDELISYTKKYHHELNEALHRGRDRLLEYNSCRTQIANEIKGRALLADANTELPEYLDAVFDCYGIDIDEGINNSIIIRPGHHMQANSFPGLPEDGMTLTYDRTAALTFEDMHFMTWEHPLVNGTLDMILSNERGNTAVTAIKYSGVKPGTMLVECLYVLESASSEKLQSNRYLPPTTIRIVVDQQNNDHESALSHEFISETRSRINAETANKIIRMHAQEVRQLVASSEKMAHKQAPEILESAHKQTKQTLQKEINRLKALRQVNPNVRDEEIQFFEAQWVALNQVLDSANLRLDAIRILVAT